MPCYLGGEDNDDADDHVPAEMLYPAPEDPVTRQPLPFPNYKKASPEDLERTMKLPGNTADAEDIITVPSCKAHNSDYSADERAFTFLMLQQPFGGAAMQLRQYWGAEQLRRGHGLDEVPKLLGIREFPGDYLYALHEWMDRRQNLGDEAGPPPEMPWLSKEEYEAIHARGRGIIDKCIRKIAAGLFYAVSAKPLGVKRVSELEIASPHFRITDKLLYSPPETDEGPFFAPLPKWDSPWGLVTSGSPQVFAAHVRWNRAMGYKFGMILQFFGGRRFWVRAT